MLHQIIRFFFFPSIQIVFRFSSKTAMDARVKFQEQRRRLVILRVILEDIIKFRGHTRDSL